VIDAPFAFAFTAGLVATVNPCGFAMLPAYLSYFLGLEGAAAGTDARAGVARALAVGAVVSSGFLVVFAVAGTLVTAGIRSFVDWVPWVALAIGIGLVVLGVAVLRGYRLAPALPKLDRGGRDRGVRSLFVFGVSYAVASLSCALPVFLVVAGTVTRSNLVSGVLAFLAYGLGMSLVLVTLTVAIALARQSMVRALRAAMRHVDRVAGVMLIVAGAYIAYYWATDLDRDPGDGAPGGPIGAVYDWSAAAAGWVDRTGGTRIGLALAAVVGLAVVYVLSRPSTRGTTGG
jgi:cytochrome c-type biogenesis protein